MLTVGHPREHGEVRRFKHREHGNLAQGSQPIDFHDETLQASVHPLPDIPHTS